MKKYTVVLEYNFGKVVSYETEKLPKMINECVLQVNEVYFSLVNVENYYTTENT